MKCPKCLSENVQMHTDIQHQGFSGGKGCCGAILLGPLGLLCGLCGKYNVKKEDRFWLCNNCGAKFTDYEARSSGGGASFISNNQPNNTTNFSSNSTQQHQATHTQIDIPKIMYGSHILTNGHIAYLNGKTFYDSWGICVDDGNTKTRITQRGSFLLSDGEMIYGFHMENLKDKRHIIKLNPDTYNYETIASFEHIITDIHMNQDVFAFSNDDDNGKLYLMNKDGTNIRKLADDKAGFITIWDKWIYYINQSDKKSIYKIKLDGSERTKIYGDKKCLNLVYDGKYFYFEATENILKTNLYRIEASSNFVQTIAEDISSYIITDTGIFINKSDEYGKCVTFSSFDCLHKKEILLKAEHINNMSVNNGYLYYGLTALAQQIDHRLNLKNGEIEPM